MTEQELIQKIIKNAEQEATAIVTEAKNAGQAKIDLAKTEAKARKEAAVKKAKQNLAIKEAQSLKAHEVEMIKARVNVRQGYIDQAFNQVRANLLKAKDADVKKIVTALTKAYATPKDTVLVAPEWAKACPNLKVTKDIAGGIVIENKIYRLELSVDVLLKNLREKMEREVAETLGVI